MLKYNIFSTCKNCKVLFISKSRTKNQNYCERCRGNLDQIRYQKRKKYFLIKQKQRKTNGS